MSNIWPVKKLGDVGQCRIGLTYTPEDVCENGGTLVLRSSNVQNGRVVYDDNVRVSSVVPEAAKVREGDILICVRNGGRNLIGKSARIDAVAAGNAFGAFMAVFRSPWNDYVFQLLQTDEFLRQVQRTLGATINQITNADLRALEFPFPPLSEQNRIADVLRTWDDAIEKLETLRVRKQGFYTLLADQLIFGERRHTEHRIERDLIRLGDVTCELNKRNRDGELGRDVVMGVTNTRGIVPMREQTIGGDLSRYQVLPPRAFAYNPMRINVGSIAMSRFSSEVLVSPDYVLFECLPGKLDPEYLDHLRQSHFWAHYINAGGSGSVRMRTYYDDLAALKIKLPGFAEQQAISAALNTLQHEISLIDKERKAIKRQKRGLMQKLLTGVWRVKVDGDEGVAA
jgi:type I restriction enzyme S subunit